MMSNATKSRVIAGATAFFAVFGLGTGRGLAVDINDYPTAARADYVFGCMQANGETRESLDHCSCSIDVIASLIPYDRYVEAETAITMSRVPGNLGNVFRATEISKKLIENLRRAQAEAEIRCF
jgi:hypothetical protein